MRTERACRRPGRGGRTLVLLCSPPPSQWRRLRATNAIEGLHEEIKRRIDSQTVLPSAATAAMLFWALLASGQTNMRKVDGWRTRAAKPIEKPIDLAACNDLHVSGERATRNSNPVPDGANIETATERRNEYLLFS